MTTTPMIERLYIAAQRKLEDAGMDFRAPWDCSLDDEERGRYEALSAAVRAVLAEMREPTPEAIKAGAICHAQYSGANPRGWPVYQIPAKAIWTSMLDAIEAETGHD